MNASRDLAEAATTASDSATPPVGANKRRPHTVGFVLFLLALLAVFGRHLSLLVTSALASDLNSYIVLIPFVSLYFLYINWKRLADGYEFSVVGVLLPLIIAASILIVVEKFGTPAAVSANDRISLVTLCFVCLLWSGGFLFLGKRWMVTAAFPMFFLIFLVPLPDRVVDSMEMGLRLASADVASLFFAVSGTPAYRTGTIFQLPNITIEVARECSGVRSSWILFVTSLIAAEMFLTRPRLRFILVAAVIPLGILRNGFRIMVIGLLCVHVGPSMIDSPIHHHGGPIFFALSLVVLFVLLWYLKRRDMLPKPVPAELQSPRLPANQPKPGMP